MKTKIFLLVLVLISLISCQKQKYGTITEKWHEPARTYVMLMPMTISSGKTFTTILIPYVIYDNEDWCIKVNRVTEKGDTISRDYYVSPGAYDTLNVGKFICIDGNCDEEDNNNKKERQ